MTPILKKRAIVYCEREFLTANGKTAHGLVRHTDRYHIVGVVDSAAPVGDAGKILDGKSRGIPLFSSLEEAYRETNPKIFIIGAVSEGGILPMGYDQAVAWALSHGLDVVSGLHYFLSEDFQRLQTILHGRNQSSRLNQNRKFGNRLRDWQENDICNVGP